MNQGKNKNLKGFTLVELIVAMGVFLVVIGVAITIFISIIQNQRKVLAEQELLNQISYVEEYMSKALRMAKRDGSGSCLGSDKEGYIYSLTRPNTESGFYRGIKFINQSDNDTCQEFFLDNLVPGDPNTPLVLKELKNSSNDSDAVPLTSDNLEISFIRFGINGTIGCYGTGENCPDGASKDDEVQPRVTILLKFAFSDGNIVGSGSCTDDSDCSGSNVCNDGKCQPVRIIQTTVSQRNLNVK